MEFVMCVIAGIIIGAAIMTARCNSTSARHALDNIKFESNLSKLQKT